MATGYFGVKEIHPGCPFPKAASAFNSSDPGAVVTCDLVFTEVARDGGSAPVWRAVGLIFTLSLLVISALEFIGFVQSHVERARSKRTRTTWAKEWYKLNTFKARMMQALVVLLAINVIRAIDPWGIYGHIPPEVGRAATDFSADANAAVLLLFDLSMSGVLLETKVPKRRLILSLLVVAAISLLTLLYLGDGLPGQAGATCYALANISYGIIFAVGGLVALLQSLPAYRRELCCARSVAPAPSESLGDATVIEASAIRVGAARATVDAAAAPSLELSSAAAALVSTAAAAAPLPPIFEAESALAPSVSQYGLAAVRSASDVSNVPGMLCPGSTAFHAAPPPVVDRDSELYGVLYDDGFAPWSSQARLTQHVPAEVDHRDLARTAGAGVVVLPGLATLTMTGGTTAEAAAGVIAPMSAMTVTRQGSTGPPRPLQKASSSGVTGGVSGRSLWVRLRLVITSAVLYVVQMVVAGICFSASVADVKDGVSPTAVVPLDSIAAVYGKKHDMLVTFWVVPALVVFLTLDGHALSFVSGIIRRMRRRRHAGGGGGAQVVSFKRAGPRAAVLPATTT